MGRKKVPSSPNDKGSNNSAIIIVAVIGLLGTLATAFFGYLSSTKPLELTIYTTQTAESKLNQLASSVPTQTLFFSTETPTPEVIVPDYWSGALQARLPTQEEAGNGILANIWLENSIKVSDLRQPDIVTYYGTAQKNKEYILPIYWCAKSKPPNTLSENLASITLQFSVNGEVIPEKYIRSYTYNPDTNWACNSHAVIINGWDENKQYILEVKRTLLKSLNDGQSNYSAGEYIYKLVVDVQ